MFDHRPSKTKSKGNTLLAMLLIVSIMLGMLMSFGDVSAETIPSFTNTPATSDLIGVPYLYSPTFNMRTDPAWRFYGNGPSWASWPSTSGIVTGTPITAGSYVFTYYLMTYSGSKVWNNWTVTVNSAPLPIFTNSPAATGTRNVAYTYDPTFSLPFDTSWRFYGTVPVWASMSSQSGNITGTPTSGGIYAFNTYLLSYTGGKVYHNWTVNVADPRWAVQITNSPATIGIVGTNYSFNPTFNTTKEASWRFYGTVPYWATFSSTVGNISGVPTSNGAYQFNIYLTGTAGLLNTYLNWTVLVGFAPFPGFDQSFNLVTLAIEDHYVYTPKTNISSTLTIIEMPSWMTYKNGILSGTPNAIGRYHVTILATSNAFGTQSVQGYDIQVNPLVWPVMNIPSMWLSVIPVFFLLVIGLVCAISREGFSVTVLMSSIAIGIGLLTWQNVLPTWSLIVTGVIIVLMLFRAQDSEVISIGR